MNRRQFIKISAIGATSAAWPMRGKASSVASDKPSPNGKFQMKSKKLEVRFDDQTHEPVEFHNMETDDRLLLTPESAFHLEFYKIGGAMSELAEAVRQKSAELLIMNARDCRVIAESQTPTSDGTLVRKIAWEGAHGQMTVAYTLGREDHFIQKEIRFEPLFTDPFLLSRVEMQRFGFATKLAEEYIPFVHGGCLTHFLRGEKSGFFFGVQVPLLVPLRTASAPWQTNDARDIPPVPTEALMDPVGTNALAYEVNFRFAEPYVSEKVFWGCYRRTGIMAPKVPLPFPCETRLSDVAPDTGESEAMLAMVMRLTSDHPRTFQVKMNGWSSGLNRDGYSTSSLLEKDEKVMLEAKKNFGPYEIEPAGTWGGLQNEISKLGPSAVGLQTNAVVDQLLSFAKQNNFSVLPFEPHGGPNPWKDLNQYCPDHQVWQCPGQQVTCPANREFFQWFTRLVIGLGRHGFSNYAEDEGAILQRGRIQCTSDEHDHLPGDASYGWFRMRREFFQRLRAEFGKDFQVDFYRPGMDLGIWECLPCTNRFTMDEFVSPSPGQAERIRYWSRIRHYYDFTPSYMDQAYITGVNGNGQLDDKSVTVPESYDDGVMLSALAVSSTFLFAGSGNDITKKWLDWARAHSDYIRAQSIFLPDWPGDGKCDAYLRVVNGKGFAFIFNAKNSASPQPSSIDIPLDASVGLDASIPYAITRVFPEPRHGETGAAESTGHWTAQLSSGEAWLVSIQPKASAGKGSVL
jgi:hypothetical protein